MPPSGGFLRSPFAILKDLFALSPLWLIKHIITLRKHQKEAALVIAVGDVFCLCIAYLCFKKRCVFLPTAKSHHFMTHTGLECWLMKRFCSEIFTRDQLTADDLSKKGLPTSYLENPMMGGFSRSKHHYKIPENTPVIGLLPGSRVESVQNLKKILSVLEALYECDPKAHYLLSLHPNYSLSNYKAALPKGWNIYKDTLQFKTLRIEITKSFGDFLALSDKVIGLAGTANEQAIHAGIPVFSFVGTGPQSSKKRFLEQQQLLGKSYHFLDESEPKKLAEIILKTKALKQAFKEDIQRPEERIIKSIFDRP